ncbi:hypothetical protein [Natronobacterium gregoryi]|uniref:Uncharacterized protein n=2 Tax=Natronobacterium gregoryi TaxID=44930 RepID=L0AII2_NATGS|nr:hypothetical protein [Natronobacterium gregoryi]AFZ73693.1 hypothetical protein Natgr_2536 [Natronobacterium gregoryi SP2]ELY67654.1 hypothetical protein C490_10807 [Natronobacterium gregoryi SP2]PLK19563.1 hypothetical protein CYV19_14100 [Natronobacterium gregoryi SP2]SFJ01352.1 hypothetical protein SAMN05443661_11170 [Natronobacterium gregoryi]
MKQKVICPHCSEKVSIDVDRKVLRTRGRIGSVNDGYDRSAVCPDCDEKFACKVEDPTRRRR